jgi:hypothetical protein
MTSDRFTSAALTTLYYEQRENGLGTWEQYSSTKLMPRSAEFFSTRPRGTRCLHEQDAVELTAFAFGLIYQIRTDEILITSVMDLRRDPSRWNHMIQRAE